MSHVRQQIRDQVATALTGLGYTVYKNRIYPIEKTSLPCIVVTTDQENSEQITLHRPVLQRRDINVSIEIIATANDTLDADLDDICVAVEAALYAGATIASDINYLSTSIELSAIGERPVGTATMNYSFIVSTLEDDPETAI